MAFSGITLAFFIGVYTFFYTLLGDNPNTGRQMACFTMKNSCHVLLKIGHYRTLARASMLLTAKTTLT